MEMEDKIVRTLDAMKHPENFTKEELDALLGDEDCVRICRDLLDSREALARRYATAPDVEAEWQSFKSRKGLSGISAQPKKKPRMLYVGIALSVAASVLLFLLLRPSVSEEYTVFRANLEAQVVSIETKNGVNTLCIPRGVNKLVVLPDSSRVWLNAESSLQYPESFEGMKHREVYLKGEGYFEVTKDAEHPFVVKTDALETQVLGTSFNVKAYSGNDTQVTLLEGSVRVTDRNNNELQLRPGEHIDAQLHKTSVENSTDYRSWIDGQFYFDNVELVEIMREFGRWYNVDIVFTHKEIMHERLHFQAERSDSLQDILELLNSMQRVKASFEKGKVVVGI